MGWQPIETAPTSGMEWLIGWKESRYSHPPALPMIWFEGCWATPDEAYTAQKDLIAEGLYRYEPTHWMPMPTPPKAA